MAAASINFMLTPQQYGLATPIMPDFHGALASGDKDQVLRDFEATFLGILLKEMRQTLEEDSLFAGDSGDVQGGLFDHLLSQHLAQAGGLGLAEMIKNSWQGNNEHEPESSNHRSTRTSAYRGAQS